MFQKIGLILIQAIEIYSCLLLIWVIASWFPRFQGTKFYSWVDKVVSPYAKIFRNLIPPIGGFDLSVIVAFISLGLAQSLIGILFF